MNRATVDEVLARVHDGLGHLPGVLGLALGGSHARGTADARSDIDIGLYYRRADRPSMDVLTTALNELDDRGRPDGVGGYGEWGPWINGGAWLRVGGQRTDILLREIDRVDRVVRDCAAGRPEIFYQVGHPHGFSTASYAGEIHHNVAFHDPAQELARLRSRTDPYPAPLAEALVARFGWESGFALDTARTAAGRGDIAYVSGCAYRSVACLNQVIFARDRRYLLNEKGAVAVADTLASAPVGYRASVDAALGRLAPGPGALLGTLTALDELRAAVLAGT